MGSAGWKQSTAVWGESMNCSRPSLPTHPPEETEVKRCRSCLCARTPADRWLMLPAAI